MRFIYFIVLFSLTSLKLVAQDEILSPLETNLAGASNNKIKRNKSIDSIILYSVDTLKLPIFDDFSTNLFQKYDSSYSGNITNTLFYSLKNKITGKPLYTFSNYTFNKSYTKTYNSITKKDTSILNKSMTVVAYNLTTYPPTFQERIVYPAYTYYDSIGTKNSHDSLKINTQDVLLDSARVFFKSLKDSNAIWIDSFAFHNYTLAYQPWSLGVASFDGLNDKGYPYAINTQSRGYGDYLTSKNIDLSSLVSADSVYISFAYQPKGFGDAPENINDGSKQQHDSLCLQVYRPDWDMWVSFWATTVESDPVKFEAESKMFKKVHLAISNPAFFKKNFKFRFVNFGDISGSLDHFHIDYVELKKDSKLSDTNVFKDFALVYPTGSLLEEFTSVPWKHYQNLTKNVINDSVTISLHNGFAIPQQNLDGNLEIFHKNNKIKSINLPGQKLSGGDINYLPLTTYNNYFDFSNEDLSFPKNSDDSATFFIKTIIPAPFEQKYYTAYVQNDTAYTYQIFRDYYAYDDGSAELAYGLKTTSATLAYKFEPYMTDSLLGVAIHFVPTVMDKSKKLFSLFVWDEKNGLPNTIIYQDNDFAPQQPIYQDKRNKFTNYYFQDFKRLQMTGTFFIGIKQFDQDPLNIGFDVNTVTNSKMYYSNSGSDWNKSLTKGALMIRPIFSSNLNKHIGLQEVSNMESQSIQLYPNPTQEFISITSTYEGYDGGILRDIHGKIVMQITHNQSTISMIDLPAGIYLFQDKITGQTYKISKL
jgi:hypothetical protein